ncbi:uncharacterized protein KY384_002378 [Bacidia gigantensis]|uniref:uncharacterized protein n=1 Tax=Bacidia gigantensis TaxID=2732470 RepID=UPI001D04755F|nr:uncharacterized protein KY384_002378 [Bacidia gigantensis]KAG8532501.1 hypothetical protein KY384_002378 [Bacidia gigantensis]
MKITQVCSLQEDKKLDPAADLYTYPIKSLRSVPLQTTAVTTDGFPYDRRFMVVRVHKDDSTKARSKKHFDPKTRLENMTITYWPELSLFLQTLNESKGTIVVEHCPPDRSKTRIEVPSKPDVKKLGFVDINLHESPTKAYKMDDHVNAWFSKCLGFSAMLIYLGPHRRKLCGNLSPDPVSKSSSWVPGVVSGSSTAETKITFADLAAYLVVTEESLADVSERLTGNMKADVTKFRPNIVVSGAAKPWDEDYWAGLTITKRNGSSNDSTEMVLTANCGRCASLNVDYKTGKFGKGEEGTVLKKMMKDRRVDPGNKYSPICGRYGFLKPGTVSAGRRIAVGDEVTLSKRNAQRTVFGKWRNQL